MSDLVSEFLKLGHEIYLFTPSGSRLSSFQKTKKNLSIFYIKTPNFFFINKYISRFFNEYFFWTYSARNLKGLRFSNIEIDLIVAYSPSIFCYKLALWIKKEKKALSYLILRDIFPRWAWDLKIIKNKIIYNFLLRQEKKLINTFDFIGIQSKSNLNYFYKNYAEFYKKFHVLHNWATIKQRNNLDKPIIYKNKFIFLYAGNLGDAQSSVNLFDAILEMRDKNILFVFIARGKKFEDLRSQCITSHLKNVVFFEPKDPFELESYIKYSHVGFFTLNHMHTTHNVPGKFITYLGHSKPVFGLINKDNDLKDFINQNNIGVCIDEFDKAAIVKSMLYIYENYQKYENAYLIRCIFEKNFNTSLIAKNILSKC